MSRMKKVLSWAWLAALLGTIVYGDMQSFAFAQALTFIIVGIAIVLLTLLAIDEVGA